MYSTRSQLSLRKVPFHSRKRKVKQPLRKKALLKPRSPPVVSCYPQFLANLKRPGTPFLSYTTAELEPICHQIAIEQMSSASSTALITSCPWICLLCEDLIVEPVTLYCGHTYCEQCIKDEEEASTDCPRCSKNIQGQIASPINYAREHHYSRNHFLKETIERSQAFKSKCDRILACHRAQNEYANGNYQQAVEILSNVIDRNADEHFALYGRAKAYAALKQFDRALTDIEQVVQQKPSWIKGYYCRGRILFEMQHFTAALLSSLQGLTLDPENQAGKKVMAQHLHAVLHNDDDDIESVTPTETKVAEAASSGESAKEMISSGTCDAKLLICRSTPSSLCLCSLFDHERLSAKDYDCSICVNLLWLPVTTPCGHVFCRECLIRSIDNTQAKCPMCKTGLENFFPMLIQCYVGATEVVAQIIETYFPKEFQERQQLHEQENIQGALIPKLSPSSSESAVFEVPIFVCVAALPHSPCPLHVFEPRYRLMIRRAMATQSRTFGMCAYDAEADTFTEYGTLLYIRGLVYTQDGRSVVDTIGRQRFRVIDRDVRDEYSVARVQLMHDNPIEPAEFDDLYQLNRTTYQHVRDWFDQLAAHRRTLITQQLEGYPVCDDLTQESTDGSSWSWQMLNLLPIEPHLQYSALTSQSFRTRLQIICNTINFLLHQQQQTTVPTGEES